MKTPLSFVLSQSNFLHHHGEGDSGLGGSENTKRVRAYGAWRRIFTIVNRCFYEPTAGDVITLDDFYDSMWYALQMAE